MYAIFLDLHKAYDALYRDRCLEILEGCIMGPRACRILCKYWDWLKMVSRTGGYYGVLFKGLWGLTHRDPLSPTIFNVVVDAVVIHWILFVAYVEGVHYGWVR